MSGIDSFLPQEQDLLIGVFFRVGYWISHIDDTDLTDVSEHNEQEHMVRALTKISTSKTATDLVRELAAEALRRSGDQARWLKAEDQLMQDVVKAVKMVKYQGTDEDFSAFRKSIMYVATSVARAYREEPEQEQEDNGRFGWLLEKAESLVMAVKDQEAYRDLNISPAEDSALHELTAALSGRAS